ncbi:hypothetical protein BLOT_003758 [Blomia tropicalis]|nr:hypothetical protein BLOT_003758 [Blomia tropicalis]
MEENSQNNLEGQEEQQKNKIHLVLYPTGGTPIIKKKNFKVDSDLKVGQIIALIRKFIKLDSSESLFVFVNQLFAPSLDQTVQNLYDCFSCEDKLILYYSKSQAWGSRKDIHPLEDNFHSMYHEVVHSGILTPQLIQLENHNSEVIRNLLSEREEYLQTLTQEQNQTIESILLSGAYTDKEINAITKNNILLTEKRCKEWRERISNVRNNQKREFCSWVKNTYEDWIRDSGRVNNSNLLNDTQKESNSPIGKDDFVEFIADDEIPMEESYTINLGSQLKTTHNLRLISVDILNFCNNRCTPHRLQTAMSLYSNSLTAIVLLQDKPIDQSHVRSEFGRLCQGTSENHFADYDVQLGDIISDIHRLKRKVKSDENVQLNIGDVFITKHSNFSEAHLVFHVVVDDSLKSPEINSRHPVILGIRNILKIAYIYDIAHISIPLLLLHHMNEDITIQWCLRRAELILKCVKGFMIEMSSLLSLNENENKTIQFVVPKDISHELFSSLSAIFPTVFRLSNTLFLTTSHV